MSMLKGDSPSETSLIVCMSNLCLGAMKGDHSGHSVR